ncbi:hypothetical protein Misp01_47260 [Microtetraspora sp. NBRC 13810]|uniref:LysR family transcriptional regulator n=1 Tax=Microtetraspora sp. NBRC 13810 TaxID=3030990 RepID=UPI0024A1BC14|nr:LysR family transcriptional regulator [Microtetraspora sp. NBRC 13810]GLW09597.1 hypothetical protein Misp01_47260 [Microtetraspora sp. NBRC 13810]
MELRLLSYVVAIAGEGSVSAAARRLHLSQPTLSRQLRELERSLGAELFTRAGRGIAPTPAGEVLVRRARTVLAEAETLLALVAAGFGAAVLPDSRRALRRVGVTPRPLAGTSTTLHLVWRSGDANPLVERVRGALTDLG